jgi:hypothetical protein
LIYAQQDGEYTSSPASRVTAGAAGAISSLGAVRGPQTLLRNALATDRTSPTTDDRAIRDEMRIERDTRMLAAQQRLPGALAGFDQLATQILAVKLRAGRKRKGMPPRWTRVRR